MSKKTVLVVDDEPTNIRILAGALKDLYRIKIASNGEIALEIANSMDPPDIILLDVMMPVLDGYETCERLKQDSKTKDIPVIFITAMNQMNEETKGLRLGAVDYISKPFHLDVVKARIKTHLLLKEQTDKLKRISLTDMLTELSNRRAFDEKLVKEWKRSKRESIPLSIILMDIDHFKLFNDGYGHLAGDECLAKVGKALRCCIERPADFVARYGGEEFACILPNTNVEGAVYMAKRIRQAVLDLAIDHEDSPMAGVVTLSLGISTSDEKAAFKHMQDLVNASDLALYAAKDKGRNRVEVYGVDN